jgi:hypothetical protein
MLNLKITETTCYNGKKINADSNFSIPKISDSDDPFVLMRKLFLDFGYNKVVKCANVFYVRIPPPPGGTAILPEYIHYYG